MNKDYLQDALHSFNLDTPNWYGWRTHDDNGNKIPNDQRMCWEHVIVIKEGAIKPTKQELENKIQELITEYNSNKYQRDRAKDYPSIQEQLDLQYWDKINGTNKWQQAINAVKQKYPK
jgi:hypothetical protein